MLPEKITREGEVLYSDRNLTKKLTITNDDGITIQAVVKVFKTPVQLQGFIDLNLRNSKAKRSMVNANRILQLGVNTPDPVGCIEYQEYNCLRECYYISRFWDHNFDLGSLLYGGKSTGIDSGTILSEIARYTVKQHNRGILHLDYNPGNILTNIQGDKVDFSLVDINRLKFKQTEMKERISGLVRLSLLPDIMKIIGSHYAKFYGIDQMIFCKRLEQAHNQFWKKRNRQKRILGILK